LAKATARTAMPSASAAAKAKAPAREPIDFTWCPDAGASPCPHLGLPLPCRVANGIVDRMPPRRDAQVVSQLLAASHKGSLRFSLTSTL